MVYPFLTGSYASPGEEGICLFRLDTERGDGELAALAREQGIRLSFLSDYQRQSGEEHSHTLVVSYPGVEPERLGSALDLLAELL